MSELAERFARELAAVAGTPHAGANAAEVALEVAGQTPIVAAVDGDTDGDGGSGGVGLDAIADELARAGHRVLRPSDASWSAELAGAYLGVTGCAAALADTGTLLLTFGPGRPRGTSLVPRVHLAIVKEGDLVPSLPDGLARVADGGRLASAMACVTGPSRSGDIEQILTLGVHGPAHVHVVLP